jgi:calreticulin
MECKDDELSHLYTLILNADNTYEVKIDNEKVESGSLEEDWAFLAPKQIEDPAASKPADWIDAEKIDDPTDEKPADWEKPEFIEDPEAKKPDDWDEEMDGQWAPAKINNPDYKGEWKAKQIDNPDYKGPWVHPKIDNPDYKPDSMLYRYSDIGAVGFDLWQVKAGTIFDNILVTDNAEYAAEVGKETWGATQEPEKAAFEKIAAAEKEAEEEKRKAEEAAKPPVDAEADDTVPTEEVDDDEPVAAEKDEL